MEQDIIDSISRMDDSALIDTAYTIGMIEHKQVNDFLSGLLKKGYRGVLKRNIKARALADENIAEYVLQY
jgi:hypothetical protein|tara:strand:+ start:2265 stop:2474 length:210 start_codon:yes stop_codon:yes gene_type:complete